jgi:hypothetical protein
MHSSHSEVPVCPFLIICLPDANLNVFTCQELHECQHKIPGCTQAVFAVWPCFGR